MDNIVLHKLFTHLKENKFKLTFCYKGTDLESEVNITKLHFSKYYTTIFLNNGNSYDIVSGDIKHISYNSMVSTSTTLDELENHLTTFSKEEELRFIMLNDDNDELVWMFTINS